LTAALAYIRRLGAPALVSPEALNVTPQLLGTPLATPQRRLYAILLDLLVIAMVSSIDGAGLMAAAVLLGLRLKQQFMVQSRKLSLLLTLLIIGCLWIGMDQSWQFVNRAPATPRAAKQRPAAVEPMTQEQIIADLREQLDQAREHKAASPVERMLAFVRERGLHFGWAVVYFTLLPYWFAGQTLGKKLFGLRVVELTGKPMTIMHCFSRYGGYAAGVATGFLGFAQVLVDQNRQAIQDKIAHTVVIDLRAAARAGK
jgi:uncharacterized RDD family membrane protein YckC